MVALHQRLDVPELELRRDLMLPRRQLSAIHPAALVEVAGLVVEILANETFTDHGMHFAG